MVITVWGQLLKAYYNKPLTDLSIAQLALLAGMPQAPNTYNPCKNPEAAKYRRDLVINAMYRNGKITEKQRDEAINTPIDDGLQDLKSGVNIPEYANDFINEAIKQANRETGTDAPNAGLKIYTTLDSKAQENLFNIVNTNDSVPFTDDELQVASTLIDTQTGGVAAQIGGRKQEIVPFGSNQATEPTRDWGSTMKPLIDYAPAFENWHLYKHCPNHFRLRSLLLSRCSKYSTEQLGQSVSRKHLRTTSFSSFT